MASCDSHADCLNTSGGYLCSCREGFAGDGQVCVRGKDATVLITLISAADYQQAMDTYTYKGLEDRLRNALASSLDISLSRIDILSLKAGSIIIHISLYPHFEESNERSATECLLELKRQTADPVSPFRLSQVYPYATVTSIADYHFSSKLSLDDVWDIIKEWVLALIPQTIKDRVPEDGLVIFVLGLALLIVATCIYQAIQCIVRRVHRNPTN